MSSRSYHVPPAGHPAQTELLTGRAVFTEAYAVIPKGVIRDIVASYLPHWDGTRVWVLARPLSGFAETFSHYLVELSPRGGSEQPEPDAEADALAEGPAFAPFCARPSLGLIANRKPSTAMAKRTAPLRTRITSRRVPPGLKTG